MARKVVHVTSTDGGKWKVKSEGTKKADSIHDRKSDAVDRGKGIAKNAPLGQIKIHGEDGKIQTEHTYGNDPKKYPG